VDRLETLSLDRAVRKLSNEGEVDSALERDCKSAAKVTEGVSAADRADRDNTDGDGECFSIGDGTGSGRLAGKSISAPVASCDD
jgi:hypothetical protein